MSDSANSETTAERTDAPIREKFLAVRGEVRDLGERRGVVAPQVVEQHRHGLEGVGLLGRAVGVLLERAAVLLEAREEGE